MMKRAIVLCAGFVLGWSVDIQAEETDSASHRVYAKPVKRPAPVFPASELRKGRQGWVVLNYVVTDEGEVVEPVVEESSGSGAFERAAISAVKRFEYEPAMLNGEPVQQCKTKVMISFALEGKEQAVSRPFYARYRRMDTAVNEGDIEKAEAILNEALEKESLTNGEISWSWAMKARIAGIRGDKDAQLTAVRRALGSSGKWIPEELREGLLTTRTVLELENGDYSSAMDSYSKLEKLQGAEVTTLRPLIDKVNALVDSEQLFFKAGEIGTNRNCETCESQWQYRPLRRSVELAEVDGELGEVEFRCDWQRYVDNAREGVTWNIPESWGDCAVVVRGQPGSTFKLFEIPAG